MTPTKRNMRKYNERIFAVFYVSLVSSLH